MTSNEAREWVLFHWTADDGATDLDWERLVDAYLAIFGRMPGEEEDAFGALKAHIQPTVTAVEVEEFEINL